MHWNNVLDIYIRLLMEKLKSNAALQLLLINSMSLFLAYEG